MQAQPDCRVWRVTKPDAYVTRTITLESPRRGETEHFIRTVFTQHYAAQVNSLAAVRAGVRCSSKPTWTKRWRSILVAWQRTR